MCALFFSLCALFTSGSRINCVNGLDEKIVNRNGDELTGISKAQTINSWSHSRVCLNEHQQRLCSCGWVMGDKESRMAAYGFNAAPCYQAFTLHAHIQNVTLPFFAVLSPHVQLVAFISPTCLLFLTAADSFSLLLLGFNSSLAADWLTTGQELWVLPKTEQDSIWSSLT